MSAPAEALSQTNPTNSEQVRSHTFATPNLPNHRSWKLT